MSLTAPLGEVDLALRKHFGHVPARASISFLGVEPIEVLRFEPIPGERAYVSLGMSRHPMTSAADPMMATDGPRAELMIHLVDPRDRFADVWRRLAVLAAAPAVEGVVHAPGMTVDLGEALVAGTICTGVVLAESPVSAVGTPLGEVAILQALPAGQNELAWARVRGSAELRERWREQGVDLRDLDRASADLT